MPRRFSEERTRKEMIDPQLEQAGWYLADHSKVKIEIPVDGYDAEPWNGVSDYCLYRENGEVLAVVEAKKTAFARMQRFRTSPGLAGDLICACKSRKLIAKLFSGGCHARRTGARHPAFRHSFKRRKR
jgi:hypothetical protein